MTTYTRIGQILELLALVREMKKHCTLVLSTPGLSLLTMLDRGL